jgi:hypothetical protein
MQLINGSAPPRPADQWTWIAYYADGSTIAEAQERGFAEVTADGRVPHTVELQALTEGLPSFALVLGPGERPVFTRTRMTPYLMSGTGEWRTIHCLGVERDDGSPARYLFWDDEGHVVLSPDRNAPYAAAPVLEGL